MNAAEDALIAAVFLGVCLGAVSLARYVWSRINR